MNASKKQIKNIWMLAREYGELAGAGGVKDVALQLGESLVIPGSRSVSMVLPYYGFMDAVELGFKQLPDPLHPNTKLQLQIVMKEPENDGYETVEFYHQTIKGVSVFLVDAERYRQKGDIYTYTEDDEKKVSWQKKSTGHHDYFAMNILLQKATLDLIICLQEKPDTIHCHDGHTALLPAMIRRLPGYAAYFRGTGCLVTIHNAGYGYHQEIADNNYAVSITGLPRDVILDNQLEQKFDPFLVAGQYALLNTVSENYARELQESENDQLTGWLGHELKDRDIVLSGVTNGIDPDLFITPYKDEAEQPVFEFAPGNPEDDLSGKKQCKAALLKEINTINDIHGVECYGCLEQNAELPLFTFVGRLSEQKGVDLLVSAMSSWLRRVQGAQLLVLGSGAMEIETELLGLTEDPQIEGRVCYLKGYNSQLADKVYGAGDFLIVPSRYEPCGLTDFIGQLFGNIPIVHHVGGLVKVQDAVTGIAYKGDEPEALLMALEKAMDLYGDTVAKREMQHRAVTEIYAKYTWAIVKEQYIDLYQQAVPTKNHNK